MVCQLTLRHLEEPAERPPPPGWVGPETERGAVVQQTAFREEETVEKKPEAWRMVENGVMF